MKNHGETYLEAREKEEEKDSKVGTVLGVGLTLAGVVLGFLATVAEKEDIAKRDALRDDELDDLY